MIALHVVALTLTLAAAEPTPAPAPAPTSVTVGGDVLTLPPASQPIGFTATDVAWKPGPPSLPAGTQAAVLEGDPTKPGIVTMRLKIAKGFRLAMHTHPADERVTVLSGTMRVTYVDTQGGTQGGTAAGQTNTRIFPAGSFYVTPKGAPHAIAVDEDTIIQITVQGPWSVSYLNAKDDPRTPKK
jgi:mannose-6-phosphate isomerase-like protein (cupin superfamily)